MEYIILYLAIYPLIQATYTLDHFGVWGFTEITCKKGFEAETLRLPQKVVADLVKSGDSDGNHTLDYYEFMAAGARFGGVKGLGFRVLRFRGWASRTNCV